MEIFKNKVLLITGGTGSFGRTVLSFYLSSDIKEIRIFSRDEKKQEEVRLLYNSEKIKYIIGDVRDTRSINAACVGVDFIFHAAALKQVPSCEFYPLEAVKTNVLGTQNVLDAAIANGVGKVICLSTDKAAYPINAMGISKAMMEKVALSTARNLSDDSNTTICVTRYGNVMASRGSVIPLFIKQIKEGKNITVTNPHMTRFLMSLHEAVELVLFAFTKGRQGDLFVQKSPACTVEHLAEALLLMLNAQNGIDIIGSRHGEKLYETLLTREEYSKAIDLGGYYRVPLDMRTLNYTGTQHDNFLDLGNEYNSENTKQLSIDEIISKIKELDLKFD